MLATRDISWWMQSIQVRGIYISSLGLESLVGDSPETFEAQRLPERPDMPDCVISATYKSCKMDVEA